MDGINEREALDALDPTRPKFEFETIHLDSVEAYDKAEAMIDDGWQVVSTTMFSVTLQRPLP